MVFFRQAQLDAFSQIVTVHAVFVLVADDIIAYLLSGAGLSL